MTHAEVAAYAMAASPGIRITPTQGSPWATEVSNITTLYAEPVNGGVVPLFRDAAGKVPVVRCLSASAVSLALGTLTSSIGYDVFAYDSGGAVALELLAWTSASARATAVDLVNGRYYKHGDYSRLLVASFYTSSTTQTQFKASQVFLQNVFNRMSVKLGSGSGASHTLSSLQADREWNAGTTPPRSEFFCGLADQTLMANGRARLIADGSVTSFIWVYVALDTASVDVSGSANYIRSVNDNDEFVPRSFGPTLPSIGYHYFTLREGNLVSATSGSLDDGRTFGVIYA
jgi:hypothetical protein